MELSDELKKMSGIEKLFSNDLYSATHWYRGAWNLQTRVIHVVHANISQVVQADVGMCPGATHKQEQQTQE